MLRLIDKSALVAEIKRRLWLLVPKMTFHQQRAELEKLLSFLDTIEVIDPYEQCIQYSSIEQGIKAHAEDYSFNIESELFNQLTKEQQALWRKEIEQACISGGYNGLDLAKDPRYEENSKVKEVDLEKEIEFYWKQCNMAWCRDAYSMTHIRTMLSDVAKHFFELGIKAQKG